MNAKRAKRKMIIFSFMSWVTMLLPVTLFNALNADAFYEISVLQFTFTFLLAGSMIGIAALTKLDASIIWVLVIGMLLAIMGEVAVQVGWSLVMIGLAMVIDKAIWSKLVKHYKGVYYEGTGRQITYTRSVD